MRALLPLAILLLAVSAHSQSFGIPDKNATVGACNVVPFGTDPSNPIWVNQRYQTILRAADLGNAPARIRGLSFAACGTGKRRHATISIAMSHVPPGYQLSPAFSTNLPSPMFVLAATDYTWQNVGGAWSPVGLQRAFRYDGVSDVVVEITVTGSAFGGTADGFLAADRPRLFATSWSLIPPGTGTLASFGALKLCANVGDATVSLHGQGCAGLDLAVTGSSKLGSAVLDAAASGGAPSQPITLITGGTVSGGFPIALGPLGLAGCFLYTDTLTAVGGTTDGSGAASFPLGPIPTASRLVGARFYLQFLHIDPRAPGGASTSNYARIVVGN